jgi:hypothetical protein
MANKELQGRLDQIKGSGVPYIISNGNCIPATFCSDDIVGTFDGGRTPEITMRVDPLLLREHFLEIGRRLYSAYSNGTSVGEYAEVFAGALGDPSRAKECFISRVTGLLDLTSLQEHRIYDPKMDLTHRFILPSRCLLDKE